MARIKHFGLHDYGGNAGDAATVIGDSAYPDRDFWMTEYSAWCGGCDQGAPNPNNWDFATGTLDDLFNFIEQGASSALIYDGYDSYYEHHGSMGYWGLLAYDAATKTYTPRKRFYTVAQVVRFARPGMVRIAAASSDNAVRVFAFTDPATGALTIVGRNASSVAVTLRGALAHVPAAATLALYQTTQSLDMARGADVSVSGGSFTADIAPDSVFTLSSVPVAGASAQNATSTPGFTSAPSQAAHPATMGNTSVGSTVDSGDANYLNGSRFTTGASAGPVTSMSVHVGPVSPAPNNQYQLAIYSDNGGSPGSLVAHTSSGLLTPGAWNTLSIRATLRPNTAYWLMYNTNGAGDGFNNMSFAPETAVPEAYSASSIPFGIWPSPAGMTVVGTGAFSIYASFATAGSSSTSLTGRVASPRMPGALALLLTGVVATGAILAFMIVLYRRRRRPERS